ncbi:MAG: multi-sensor hybrid histidine kinase [Herbinix sp.]|jgi:signal transduction histidine kinase/ActR/RegA family two-component response regulator|nr:multi-sensor hybrid histidine kinase [Herbinix sp.]
MFRRLSIKAKLIIINLIVIIPVTVLGIINIRLDFDKSIEYVMNTKLDLAQAISSSLMNYIGEVWIKGQDISTYIVSNPDLPPDDINQYLKKLMDHQDVIQTITWLNPKGVVLNSSRDDLLQVSLCHREYIKKIIQGEDTCISNIIVSLSTGDPILPVSVGIRNEDELVGIMLLVINIQKLGEKFDKYCFQQGDIFQFIDGNGKILYHSSIPDIYLTGYQLSKNDPIRNSLKGKTIKIKELKNKDMQRMCISYPIEKIGWAVTISSRYDMALNQEYSNMIYWIIALMAVVGSSITAAFFLNGYIRKPMLKLRSAAKIVASGDYTVRTGIDGKDEIAVTAKVFDTMVGVLKDKISDLKLRETQLEQSNKALIEAKAEADKANFAKSKFLSNMSHEIRTPVNGIIGFVDIMLRTEISEIQKSYLTHMKLASNMLLIIINDILDYSKIQSGKLTLDESPFRLSELIEETVALVYHKAYEKGVTLSKTIREDIPPVLVGDPIRLKQIIANILSNSVKFTDQGYIHIDVTACTTKHQIQSDFVEQAEVIKDSNSMDSYKKAYSLEDSKIILHFRITDTGCGISKENQDIIFKPFTQDRSNQSKNHGGTGLGLTICYELVKIMDGEIGVISEVGKGSTFYFTVTVEPYIQIQDRNEKPFDVNKDKETRSTINHHKLRVLLVEDNEINIMVAKEHLNFDHIICDVAEDGSIALQYMENEVYDIIFMDCQMPVMDGFQTTREIRRREKENKRKSTPIIALTANIFSEEVDKCKAAGMDDYISKPFTREDILKVFHKYLNE